MNNLLISIAKERLLPTVSGVIDYPIEYVESQLYRLSIFILSNILNSFILIPKTVNISQKDKVDLILSQNFPEEWLKVALTSTHHYLNFSKTTSQFDLNIEEELMEKIYAVVEFLCYEIIETSVIKSNYKLLMDITPNDILNGIHSDTVLTNIMQQHNIIITDYVLIPPHIVRLNNIAISNQSLKMIRVYIEEIIKRVYTSRKNKKRLTVEDVKNYFNIW